MGIVEEGQRTCRKKIVATIISKGCITLLHSATKCIVGLLYTHRRWLSRGKKKGQGVVALPDRLGLD